MQETIFTKICKGEIRSHKIYEDERTFAFLDIHPVQPGMVLVVTKTPYPSFLELSDTDAAALWATVRKIGAALRASFPDKKRIAVQIEGLDVPHVHVKLFPVDTGDEFRASPASGEPDHDALSQMAEKISKGLSQ